MRLLPTILLVLSAVAATPLTKRTTGTFTSSFLTHHLSPNAGNVSLRFVKNSGVCETTPGVNQLSGYIEVGKNMSMWFWFFEARNKPETAPFTLWLNGGPGCSSMIGLFQEHGPCQVNADEKTTVLNPNSWNELSNSRCLPESFL
jgi:carboxypeptidase C (cathepsin A)